MNNQTFLNNPEGPPQFPMDYSNYYNYPVLNPTQPTFHSVDPRLNPANKPPVSPIEQPSMYYVENKLDYDLTLPAIEPEVEQKTDDELYIETWLSKIGKIQINLDSTIEIIQSEKKPKRIQNNLKISAAKQSLKKCLLALKKLEETEADLKANVSTMSSIDWKKKTIDIGNLKDEFVSSMSQFENGQFLLQLKKDISQRSKKRRSQKRRKINKRKDKQLEIEKNKKLHEDIDQWLDSMKDAIERAKAEESMQKDADCVLSEVTKKKSDSRKQLSLISALIKLRNVRENIALHRAERINPEDKSAFNTITEKLTNMWEDMTKIYAKEEQGLKIMLEKNADNKTPVSKTDRSSQAWDFLIFGPKVIPCQAYWGLTSAEKNLETFVAIRKSWDTFLNAAGDGDGSKIPVGWVFPPENANENWTKYLSV